MAMAKAILALMLCACSAVQERAGVTPIHKVLELMTELLTESRKGKEDEAVKFSAFSQWCKGQSRTKTNEIEEDKEKIEQLSASIEKSAVNIKQTDARIKELDEDVARWTRDKKSAGDVRHKEKEDYTATLKGYQSSLEALDGAIEVVKKNDVTRPQAQLLQTMLLQVQSQHRSAPTMPAQLAQTLAALTQESSSSSDTDSLSASMAESTQELAASDSVDENPQAAGYVGQSGGVLDLMGGLKDKFSVEKTNLEKDELNAQNAYELLSQQLHDNIEGAETELSQKNTLLTQDQQAKADHEGDKDAMIKERDEDSAYLKDTTEMCTVKTNDFHSRQKLRQEEIEALTKAMEIVGGADVAGAAVKNLPTLLQRSSALAHLRSDPQSPMQGKIAVFLSERARSLGSALLLDVAQRVESDPFKKVKRMVQNLISKLMTESTDEIEHKGWCDTELTTNQQTRDKKTEEAEQLNFNIEDLEATVVKLTQDNAELSGAIDELDKAMTKATEERHTAKATNTATMKEAKDAITAVDQAIAVLKDYYAKSAEATAFVQAHITAPADDAPEAFEDKPFNGNQAQGGGIVDFLEVILSDFTRLDSETTSSEAMQEEEYKNYMFESSKDRALKAGQIDNNDEKKTQKSTALHDAKEDLAATQESLDKAVKYYEKLKPDCVDSGISYAERVQKREAEIVSLQEALKILQDGN